jgi:hypothetical protein
MKGFTLFLLFYIPIQINYLLRRAKILPDKWFCLDVILFSHGWTVKGRNAFAHPQRSKIYCLFMNLIDFRYWNCDCHYQPPYGLVIMADCKKHD